MKHQVMCSVICRCQHLLCSLNKKEIKSTSFQKKIFLILSEHLRGQVIASISHGVETSHFFTTSAIN